MLKIKKMPKIMFSLLGLELSEVPHTYELHKLGTVTTVRLLKTGTKQNKNNELKNVSYLWTEMYGRKYNSWKLIINLVSNILSVLRTRYSNNLLFN